MFGAENRRTRMRRNPAMRPAPEGLESRVVLSTFKVSTTLDTVAVSLKTGKDASGQVSLRSAIMAADSRGGSSTIKLPAGTFTLTNLVGGGELDISGNITIKGSGAGATVIDGNNQHRVIHVLSGKVSISGVSIVNGSATGQGGGILNSGGQLTLSSVTLQNNEALGLPGSTGTSASATPTVTFANGQPVQEGGPGGDGTNGGNAAGGAVYNAAGSLAISNSVIKFNQAVGGDGGDGKFGGPGFGTGTSSDNNGIGGWGGNGGKGGFGGTARGGGIFNASGAILSLSGNSFIGNQATGGDGGGGGAGNFGLGADGGADVGLGAGVGGLCIGGSGGAGGPGGSGAGGGLFNFGSVSLTGGATVVNGNHASGGAGGAGGVGNTGVGGAGNGGNSSTTGGDGSFGIGGNGGSGGASGFGIGGGVSVGPPGSLTIKLRLGARKRSKQAGATDLVTGNQADAGIGGLAGPAGGFIGGHGGTPNGPDGNGQPGLPGAGGSVDSLQAGEGGGIAIFGTATIDNTSITGNLASKRGKDVQGTFST